MQRILEIGEIVALAWGKAVDINNMDALLGTLREADRTNIILVDWYAPTSDRPDVEDLMMITFRCNTAPRMFQLDPDLVSETSQVLVFLLPSSTTPEWTKA